MSILQSVLGEGDELDKVPDMQALTKAGAHHSYQYYLLLCNGLAFWVTNAFTIGLAYEAIPPTMLCSDGQTCSYSRACIEGGYSFHTDSLRNWTYEWKLVCERQYIGSLIGIANFAGIAVGSLVSSWTTNRYGRKNTAIVGMGLQTAALIVAYLTPSPYFMILVSGIIGVGFGLAAVGAMLHQMELTNAKHRSWFVGVLYGCWSASTITQPILFYLMPDWRYVMLPVACIAIIPFGLLFTVVESVRWLAINQNDRQSALAALTTIARFNGRPGVGFKLTQKPTSISPSQTSIWALFSSWKQCYRVFVLSILEIMMNLGYYGLYFAIPSYFGDIFVNGVVLGVGELIPFIVFGKIMADWPRKFANFSTLMGSGLSLLLAWTFHFVPCSSTCTFRNSLQTIVLFLGIFLVSSYCVAIMVICIEVFNSHVRGPASGLLTAMARIGGAIATLLLLMQTYWDVQPLILVGGAAVVSSLLVFTLPETLGRDMEEDI